MPGISQSGRHDPALCEPSLLATAGQRSRWYGHTQAKSVGHDREPRAVVIRQVIGLRWEEGIRGLLRHVYLYGHIAICNETASPTKPQETGVRWAENDIGSSNLFPNLDQYNWKREPTRPGLRLSLREPRSKVLSGCDIRKLNTKIITVFVYNLDKTSTGWANNFCNVHGGTPEVIVHLCPRMPRNRWHPKVQQKITVLIALKPNTWNICDPEDCRYLIKELSIYGSKQVPPHPIEATANVDGPRPPNPLQVSQLVIRKCPIVCFIGVFAAESNHSLRVVMLLNAPGGIEVMPCQVWAPAALYGTAEPHLLTQDEFHGAIGISGWAHVFPNARS